MSPATPSLNVAFEQLHGEPMLIRCGRSHRIAEPSLIPAYFLKIHLEKDSHYSLEMCPKFVVNYLLVHFGRGVSNA